MLVGGAAGRDHHGVERFLLVLVLVAVAVGVTVVVERRRRPPAPTNVGHTLPDQLDRADFARPEAPWLVAVFTSATCATCAGVWDKARILASDDVAVQKVEVATSRDLHGRYRITAVPAVVVADAAGVVRSTFLGPVTAELLAKTGAKVSKDFPRHHCVPPPRPVRREI